MQLKTKAQLLLICYFSAMVLVPVKPSPYTFFIDTVGSVVSLTSIGFIFFFYFASVPSWQRTCIQGLSQLLLVWLAVVVIRAYFASLMVNILHDTTQQLLMEYPTLSCILFSGRITFVPSLVSLLLLEISRLGLLLFTIRFQSMNHDLIVYACVAFTVGASLLDLLLSFIFEFANYCINISKFAKEYNFQLRKNARDENNFFKSPLPVISFSILATEIAYQVIVNYRKFKENEVNILPKQVQESTATTSVQSNEVIRLAPSLNPANRITPRKRHSSFSLQIREKTNFRKLSLDSLTANYNVKKNESPFKGLKLNSWTGRSLTKTSATRNTAQHVAINVDNSVQRPVRKSKCTTFTLILISIQSIFVIWSIINNYDPQVDSIFVKFVGVAYTYGLRFIKYCLGLYWIYESEKLSEFTLTKSKQFLARLLSFHVWPMSIQNLANMLQ